MFLSQPCFLQQLTLLLLLPPRRCHWAVPRWRGLWQISWRDSNNSSSSSSSSRRWPGSVILLMALQFIFQTPAVRYFYCSSRLTHMKASQTEDFAACPFFERELEAARKRGAEWKRVAEERAKRKSVVNLPTGRLCRFCHQPLMQGISSPHTHTCFPGIYCPSRVFSLYKEQGMVEEMTWRDFQQTLFFEAERDRWAAEKRKWDSVEEDTIYCIYNCLFNY